MGKKANKKQMKNERRWPLRLRVLALMLVLSMLLTSSGMQILAKERQTETVSEEETEETEAAKKKKKKETESSETSEETEKAAKKTENTDAEEKVESAEAAKTVEAQASETQAETEASKTKETQAETEAPKTKETQAETEASKTKETQAETEASKTKETQAETEAPKTKETQAETEVSKTKETQAETEAPKTKETQAETEAPKTQETQAETEAPKTQETQAATEAPKTQETQAATEAPKTQETQAETEAPKTKETQAETEAPKTQETQAATEAPKTQETQAETEATKTKETQAETQAATETTKTKETQAATEAPKTQETQAATEANKKSETQTETEVTKKSETEASRKSETQIETETTKKSETQTEKETTKKSETQTETEVTKKSETQTETEATKKSETQAETDATKKSETQIETEATGKSKTQTDTEAARKSEAQTETETSGKSDTTEDSSDVKEQETLSATEAAEQTDLTETSEDTTEMTEAPVSETDKTAETDKSDSDKKSVQKVDLEEGEYLNSVSIKITVGSNVYTYEISKEKINDADAVAKTAVKKTYYELNRIPEDADLEDAKIEAELTFKDVVVSSENALLYYQIPKKLVSELKKSNGNTDDGKYINGTYEVKENGRVEITPDADYIAKYQQKNGTTVLTIKTVSFQGTYSEKMMQVLIKMITSEDVIIETEKATEEEETEELTEEATEGATEEQTEEATEQQTEEAIEEQTEEVTKEQTEEATEEVTEAQTEEATEEQTEKVTGEPTEKAAEEPTEEATEKQTEKVTGEPTEKAAEEATEKQTEKVIEEPTEEPTEEATEEQTEETTEEAIEEPTEKVTEAQTEKSTEAQTEKSTEKQTEKSTEAQTEKATEQQTEKATEKQTEKATEAQTEETPQQLPEEATGKAIRKLVKGAIEQATKQQTEETAEVSSKASVDASVIMAASELDDEEELEELEEITTSGLVKAKASANTRDITSELDPAKITMKLRVKVDGKYYWYTIDELNAKGLQVAKATAVKIEMGFKTIKNIEEGQILTYQLPGNLLDPSYADENGILFSCEVIETNNEGATEAAADLTIDKNGLMTVTLRNKFFKENKFSDGTLDLYGFKFTFSGYLSSERGEHSGKDDAEIWFSGESTADTDDDIHYTIPFEYKNENAHVELTKTNEFDPATKYVTYTVTATAPKTNTLTADNVVLTDTITGSGYFKGNLYQNVKASTGTSFDRSTGVWTIGDMEPGDVATLTYKMKVGDNFFTTQDAEIINHISGSYNNDVNTTVDASSTLKDLGTVIINKKIAGSRTTDENGNTYIPYTLTVTAYGADVDNVRVTDVFNRKDAITSYELFSSNSISQGTMEYVSENGGVTMNWNVGTVKEDTPATLTYKAYLSGDAWDKYGTLDNAATEPTTLYLKLTNTATVYANDVNYGSSSAETTQKKTWITKTGKLSNSTVTYTITLNDAPMSGSVKYIQDKITNGTYDENGYITMTRYRGKGKAQVGDTVKIPVSKVINDDKGGWYINLKSVPVEGEDNPQDLSGPYYYVLTYTATGLGHIGNTAGVGFGTGGGGKTYLESSYGIDGSVFEYSKSLESADVVMKGTDYGKLNWKVTIKSQIPEDSGIIDTTELYSSKNGYKYTSNYTYYTKAQIDGIVVKLGDDTLGSNDYEIIEYTKHSTANGDGHDDTQEDQYCGFKLRFKHLLQASSTKPLTISYSSTVNMVSSGSNGYMKNGDCTYTNHATFAYYIGTDDQVKMTEKTAKFVYQPVQNQTKTGVGYNSSTGEAYWYIVSNRQSMVSGTAYITEELPYYLTYAGAETMIGRTAYGKDGTTTVVSGDPDYSYAGDTTYSTITGTYGKDVRIDYDNIKIGYYYDEKGRKCQKVTIPLTGLHGLEDFMNNPTTYQGFSYTNSSWYKWGMFTIRVRTKVSDDILMSLESLSLPTETYMLDQGKDKNGRDSYIIYNTATFTADDYTLCMNSNWSSCYVPKSTTKLITKELATEQNPAYLRYTLDINPNALTLTDGENALEVVDIMNTGMSLATEHSDYFKVYDMAAADAAGTDYTMTKTKSDGTVTMLDPSKVASLGTDITDQCLIEDVTGQSLSGLAASDVGKPVYKIDIPDEKHVVVLYWASYVGTSDNDTVTLSNTARFYYKGVVQSGSGDVESDDVIQVDGSAEGYSTGFFYVSKKDQWNNPVKGVTYTLYRMDSVTSTPVKVMERTTGDDGTAMFGTRDDSNEEKLVRDKLYYIVETSAPAGYQIDSTPYYFEFKSADQSAVAVPSGATLHRLKYGSVCSFTNQFEGTYYDMPVKKTLNNQNLESTTEFSFTLKQTADSEKTAYTDNRYRKELEAEGLSASIKGSGETTFDRLYFKEEGVYKFTLTEDALTQEALDNGYTKDNTVYTVTVVVGSENNKLVVTSVTVTPNTEKKANGTTANTTGEVTATNIPRFDNTFQLTGTLQLSVKKIVEYRAAKMTAGEFQFKVSVDGKVVPELDANGDPVMENGKYKSRIFTNDENGDIAIDIPIDQDDVGTHTYIISEIEGDDPDITYSTDNIMVTVTIVEAGNGKVKASSIIYPTDDEEDEETESGTGEETEIKTVVKGHAEFTNTYNAEGTLTLKGTKKLMKGNQSIKVAAGEFDFVVKEGKTKVATGTTKDGGEIEFTDIQYYASDIGEHTYTISEVEGDEPLVEYTEKTVQVKVTVSDAGQGKLNATAKYLDSEGNDLKDAEFVNEYIMIVATGVRVDTLPYVMMIAIAVCSGMLLTIHKRKKKSVRRR